MRPYKSKTPWFEQVLSVSDAHNLIAGWCLCRHPPEKHRTLHGGGTWCDVPECAIECILPPPAELVQEAHEYLRVRNISTVDMDKIAGYLEVGHNKGEVVINHPQMEVDAHGVGHIVFSPDQARALAAKLCASADDAVGYVGRCGSCGHNKLVHQDHCTSIVATDANLNHQQCSCQSYNPFTRAT